LTPEGQARRKLALELLSQPPSAFEALTRTEQRQLRDLLRKLTAADPELVRASARSTA
jgi:hypothetical protein